MTTATVHSDFCTHGYGKIFELILGGHASVALLGHRLTLVCQNAAEEGHTEMCLNVYHQKNFIVPLESTADFISDNWEELRKRPKIASELARLVASLPSMNMSGMNLISECPVMLEQTAVRTTVLDNIKKAPPGKLFTAKEVNCLIGTGILPRNMLSQLNISCTETDAPFLPIIQQYKDWMFDAILPTNHIYHRDSCIIKLAHDIGKCLRVRMPMDLIKLVLDWLFPKQTVMCTLRTLALTSNV